MTRHLFRGKKTVKASSISEEQEVAFIMIRARIVGTGSTTPKRILTNKDLEAIVDTSDDWIIRRTGIKERRISTNGQGENTSELATAASL
ncbi:MAG: hypothetical protein KAT27_03765, partial [Desulfobacterales bacterium]|nr:hypothetical protein [Desulfobacterales bacterium]